MTQNISSSINTVVIISFICAQSLVYNTIPSTNTEIMWTQNHFFKKEKEQKGP